MESSDSLGQPLKREKPKGKKEEAKLPLFIVVTNMSL